MPEVPGDERLDRRDRRDSDVPGIVPNLGGTTRSVTYACANASVSGDSERTIGQTRPKISVRDKRDSLGARAISVEHDVGDMERVPSSRRMVQEPERRLFASGRVLVQHGTERRGVKIQPHYPSVVLVGRVAPNVSCAQHSMRGRPRCTDAHVRGARS